MQGQKTQLNLSILKIIWGALLGSHLMYGLALNFLVGQNSNVTEEVNSFFLPLLSSMAIILFFIAIFSQKYFLGIAKKQLVVKFGQVDLSRLNIEDLIANFISPYVIRLALFEAVALFGFSLSFLNKDIKYFIPFATVSIVAYFFNFPSEEKVRNAFK
jgi:hypothetical protein